MSTTLIADHIESLLLEMDFASRDIESCAPHASADEVEGILLQALETARRALEEALDHAQENGVPKLSIEAA